MTAPVRWFLGFLVWTVLALLSASQTGTFLMIRDEPVVWPRLIIISMINWYTCAIFTPVFFAAARRWPVDGRSWLRNLPLHALLCAIASVIKFALERELRILIIDQPQPPLGRILAGSFISENIAFWCMAAAIHAIEFHRRVKEREVVSARLVARLSEAQLEVLAARLQPHFLFNTLQAISTLVHRDPGAADQMLGRLSTLLRRTLQAGGKHEVTLAEEMAMLEDYLAIAETRFGNRLTIVRDVPAETHAAQIPYLVLQPLLENAFEHGIARKAGAGLVSVSAARHDGRLRVTVTDDGRGPDPSGTRDGIGLGTTRARLQELYGDAARLSIDPAPGGGTAATLEVPWHTEPVR